MPGPEDPETVMDDRGGHDYLQENGILKCLDELSALCERLGLCADVLVEAVEAGAEPNISLASDHFTTLNGLRLDTFNFLFHMRGIVDHIIRQFDIPDDCADVPAYVQQLAPIASSTPRRCNIYSAPVPVLLSIRYLSRELVKALQGLHWGLEHRDFADDHASRIYFPQLTPQSRFGLWVEEIISRLTPMVQQFLDDGLNPGEVTGDFQARIATVLGVPVGVNMSTTSSALLDTGDDFVALNVTSHSHAVLPAASGSIVGGDAEDLVRTGVGSQPALEDPESS